MRNYRDLQVWRRAHDLTLDIYVTTRAFPTEEKYGLTSQIRRASVSIGANVAEGCGRRSEAEFARFVRVAMGSGAELSYELLVARDCQYSSVGRLRPLGSRIEHSNENAVFAFEQAAAASSNRKNMTRKSRAGAKS